MGSSPSRQRGQTEPGRMVELTLQPWRGWGRQAVSQQRSLGSGMGHRGINYNTRSSVYLSWGKLTCPHPVLLPDWVRRDRFLQRAIQSKVVSGAFGCAQASRGREEDGRAGWFSRHPAVHPAVMSATLASPSQPCYRDLSAGHRPSETGDLRREKGGGNLISPKSQSPKMMGEGFPLPARDVEGGHPGISYRHCSSCKLMCFKEAEAFEEERP